MVGGGPCVWPGMLPTARISIRLDSLHTYAEEPARAFHVGINRVDAVSFAVCHYGSNRLSKGCFLQSTIPDLLMLTKRGPRPRFIDLSRM